jgi:diacylglycerol kinase (ATP)
MKTGNIQIVINPTAGSGKANRVAYTLLQKIKPATSSDIQLCYTGKKGDATAITRRAVSEGASMIIAVGGDGTINEVVNGFFLGKKPINPLCELGIINCGTGGGFAKTLNNPGSVQEQIELLFRSESALLDLGCISYKNNDGTTVSRLFVNECQIGIGSEVAARVGKKSKVFGGKIAFGVVATILALHIKPVKVKIGFDDNPADEFSLIGLVVGNGTECAGGMKLTPDAKLNDGYFDVLFMNEMNVFQRILNLSKVYSGKHILSKHFPVRRCKKLIITSGGNLLLEGDGEIIGNPPFEIELIPSSIRLKSGYKLN